MFIKPYKIRFLLTFFLLDSRFSNILLTFAGRKSFSYKEGYFSYKENVRFAQQENVIPKLITAILK